MQRRARRKRAGGREGRRGSNKGNSLLRRRGGRRRRRRSRRAYYGGCFDATWKNGENARRDSEEMPRSDGTEGGREDPHTAPRALRDERLRFVKLSCWLAARCDRTFQRSKASSDGVNGRGRKGGRKRGPGELGTGGVRSECQVGDEMAKQANDLLSHTASNPLPFKYEGSFGKHLNS